MNIAVDSMPILTKLLEQMVATIINGIRFFVVHDIIHMCANSGAHKRFSRIYFLSNYCRNLVNHLCTCNQF